MNKISPNEFCFLSDATAQILEGNYYEALASLQNCEEYIKASHKPIISFVSLTVMHNTALCFYRLQTSEQALDYLEKSLKICKSLLKTLETSTDSLKLFKYISITHLKICAVFSQTKSHENALKHAQSALRYMKELIINSVLVISSLSLKKKSDHSEAFSKISFVLDKIISKKLERKVKIFLGEDWILNYNISNVMTMQPVLLSEWTAPFILKQELNLTKTLENICGLVCCYFSVATELRFLAMTSSAHRNLKSKEWHERALEICKSFLPRACPLFQHIRKSFEKHYGPVSKTQSPVVPLRFGCKRESEKGRNVSVKSFNKVRQKQALRKNTPGRKKSLASTQKVSCKGKKSKRRSAGIFSDHPIMATHKINCESSGSEKCKG
jgi:tetratricopeptide (TPR) repeat protein